MLPGDLILSVDGDGSDDRLVFLCNAAVIVGGLGIFTYCVHNLHALGYIAEGGIAAVKEGGVLVADEKLRACAVWCHGSCH